jgi:Major Facilitator Superfamily
MNATTIPKISARTSRNAWLMVACLFVFYVYSFLDRTTIAMLVDPIRADLRITDTQMSLLVGFAFAMAYSFGGLPWSWLVDRFPRRLILFLGVTFWGLATAACGTAGTFTQLFLARFAVGLGEAPLHPASHSMISDAFPRRDLAKAISVYSLGSVIGAGLALVAGAAGTQEMMALAFRGETEALVAFELANRKIVVALDHLNVNRPQPGSFVSAFAEPGHRIIEQPIAQHAAADFSGADPDSARATESPHRSFACHYAGGGPVAVGATIELTDRGGDHGLLEHFFQGRRLAEARIGIVLGISAILECDPGEVFPR